MKKVILSFLMLLCMAGSANAQKLLRGDANNDGDITVADLTRIVNVILGKDPREYIDLTAIANNVENDAVVGTWVASDGTRITFNADGTTDMGEGYTYKYRPIRGMLSVYNASSTAVNMWMVTGVEDSYMMIEDLMNEEKSYYINSNFIVSAITLSESAASLTLGATCQLTATITPTDAVKPGLTWTSSDESVATVDETGLVTAKGAGTATITCAATDGGGVNATCEVTVIKIDRSGTIDGRDYVDLDLASGTLWATCNVGASSPEEYGDYFAWGETEGYNSGKTNFSWSTYKYCQGSNKTFTKYCFNSSYGYNGYTDKLTELDPLDDAAYVNWGSDWCMPSLEQYIEIFKQEYTTNEMTTQNGVYGWKITSKGNGNSIFLPAAGCRDESSLQKAESIGCYWILSFSTMNPDKVWRLIISSSTLGIGEMNRYLGASVRPVRLSK